MGRNYLFFAAIIFCSLTIATALQCYKCGQYNDGVGSITPCINYTHMRLEECPTKDHLYCIKYLSEGSTVRDCVPKCTERDTWGTRTFCCNEDACNSSTATRYDVLFTIAAFILTVVMVH